MAVHNHDTESITFMDGWTTLKQKKNKKKVFEMNEQTKNEIEKSLQYVGMTLEEAEQKYESICAENSVEVSSDLGVALWRSFVQQSRRSNRPSSSSDSGGLAKKCFGMFIMLDAPRDMMRWKRNRAIEEYKRDSNNALEKGIVAIASENALGKWVISRYYKGSYEEKTVGSLPNGAEEGEDGQYFIPLDDTPRYMNGGENKQYGKPLPVEQFRRQGLFYGSADGGEMKMWPFSYKNQPAVDFSPNVFEWVHFMAIPNENGSLYGMTETTLNSLVLNNTLEPDNSDFRNMNDFNVENFLTEKLSEHIVPLVDIDRAHTERQALEYNKRFIVTDGVVCGMNMTATSNGNRILNITDLNAEFDYSEDGGVLTCWIPEHIEIDFGIGSSVIVIGNTSQRTVDGETEPATLNVSGLLALEKKGSVVESSSPVEEDYDWF